MIAFLLTLADAAAIDFTTAQSRAVMTAFADCMAKSYNGDARQLVEVDEIGVLTAQQVKLFRPECLRFGAGALKGNHSLYRFALAEALLHREFRKAAPPNPALAAPIDHPIFAADASPPANYVAWGAAVAGRWPEYRDRARAYSIVSAFGDCVVRAAPAKTWALLQTKVTSAAEKTAMAGLSTEMGSCVPAGTKIELSPNNIRGTIALNYYRMSKAREVAPGAPR